MDEKRDTSHPPGNTRKTDKDARAGNPAGQRRAEKLREARDVLKRAVEEAASLGRRVRRGAKNDGGLQ